RRGGVLPDPGGRGDDVAQRGGVPRTQGGSHSQSTERVAPTGEPSGSSASTVRVRAGSDPMNVVGLVMAGGRGERARRSIADISRPRVDGGGATLLERSLLALVEAGSRKLVVSVSAADSALSSFVADRCGTLVGSWGGSLELLAERWPRGNIGCAAELRGRG